MTPEQKQQAKQLIADWTNVSKTSTPAVWFLNGDCMAGFLQELVDADDKFKTSVLAAINAAAPNARHVEVDGQPVFFSRSGDDITDTHTLTPCPHCGGSGAAEDCAPEPEPFGYFKAEPFGWTDCAETDDGAIALFAAPPAPSVPDGWRGLTDVEWMNIVNFDSAYSSYDKEGAVNDAVKRTEAKLKELNAAQQQEPPADLVRDAERWAKYMYLIGSNSNKAAEILDIVDAAIERDKLKGQS